MMHLKKYTFFSFLLIVIVGGLVYSQVDAKYTINVLGVPVELPVAAWVILPMIIFYFASLFHMAYYSFRNYLREKKYKKDYKTLVVSLFRAIFHEPQKNYYRMQEFKNIGAVTDRAYITLKEFNFECKEDSLKKAVEYIKDIQRGDFVEIKEIELSPNNPINLKNLENRMKKEPTYSGVILKKCNELGDEICKKALKVYITFADMAKIKDYAKLFDKEILFELIKNAKDKSRNLALEPSDIVDILKESKADFDAKDYIDLAKEVKNLYMPDERIKLFEKLKKHNEKAESAYIFTLLDLEMIDRTKDELEKSQEDEFLNFKAFLELKECGRDYPLELFI